ncbi:hypothetical protein [Bradyrhizobium sp. WD16]|uniref:hypothetical protein n=1 Tax=Bradyrhizobium sp. WD16 TaxID=1521768 RepID=UPI0020A24276|nr:hypothetical protein [Bradyrhizobium sp. WD16]
MINEPAIGAGTLLPCCHRSGTGPRAGRKTACTQLEFQRRHASSSREPVPLRSKKSQIRGESDLLRP